jgi:D-amino-acid dehydrogenase
MLKWMAKFLFYTYRGDYKKNTSETIKMALESRNLYDKICKDESIEHNMFDRSDCGILHFYKSESYWKNAQDVTVLYNSNGLDRRTIKPEQFSVFDPALSYINDSIGGTMTPSDWTGDIHKFTYHLAETLRYRYKVEFNYETKVESIDDIASGYDKIIIANGVGSTKLAESIYETIDVYPVKGYSITINNVDPKYLPKVSLLDDEAKIVTSSLGNKFRVAGTAELTGENYDIRRDRIEPLLKWVHTNFPKINTHDYTQWACLRPMTPNMMPIIRQSKKHDKVYYNTGHGHLGWTLGPYTAKTVCEVAGLI